jgi:2-polyprenyl-3-methyl-5-hydroxy-6-metoxy-1,4-benzoquinol methylase
MENNNSSFLYLGKLIQEIEKQDKLHTKTIRANISYVTEHYSQQLEELLGLVKSYFEMLSFGVERVADDYLKMIRDMRVEGLYFYRHGKYRCANQQIAYEYVYSKPDVMTYYMNALLVSQILWKHHFNIFMFFQETLKKINQNRDNVTILDIGPGHGFFSYLVKKEFPEYQSIDIVDISETSLEMTKKIIGFDEDKINYKLQDIFDYDGVEKYDFIVLGEVIEHLDEPELILKKLGSLLKPEGVLWLTTPTNAPALDHVYLFNNREEVFSLVKSAGLDPVAFCNFFADDVNEETAIKNRITDLVGIFCRRLEI